MERQRLEDKHGRSVPLVLKVSPDMNDQQIDAVASLLRKHRIDGVAATNTTLSRDGLVDKRYAQESGGLSGQPVSKLSTETIHKLYNNLQGEIPIIGIGGIVDAASALEKCQAGAQLVQIYTGLVYNGPSMVKDIAEAFTTNSHLKGQSY